MENKMETTTSDLGLYEVPPPQPQPHPKYLSPSGFRGLRASEFRGLGFRGLGFRG